MEQFCFQLESVVFLHAGKQLKGFILQIQKLLEAFFMSKNMYWKQKRSTDFFPWLYFKIYLYGFDFAKIPTEPLS